MLGFELECYMELAVPETPANVKACGKIPAYLWESNQVMERAKEMLLSAVDEPWVFELDATVDSTLINEKAGVYGVEFITPPWEDSVAVSRLSKLLDALRGIATTDETCGLHVNISGQHRISYRNIVARFPAFEMAKRYGRETNQNCLPPSVVEVCGSTLQKLLAKPMLSEDEALSCLQVISEGTKRIGIIEKGEKPSTYLEFRLIGNANYQFRQLEILEDIKTIQTFIT